MLRSIISYPSFSLSDGIDRIVVASSIMRPDRPAQLYNSLLDSWSDLPMLGQDGYPWTSAWVLNGHTFYVTGSREDRGLVMYLSLSRYLETGIEGLSEWQRLPSMNTTLLDTVEVLRL